MLPSAPLPLLVTTGEPAGIGPELTLMLAAQKRLAPGTLAVGDPKLLAERAEQLGLEVDIVEVNGFDQLDTNAARPQLGVWPVWLRAPCTPGVCDPANAAYVIETLEIGVRACREGKAGGIVTAPLNKGVIIDGGFTGFTGHTEWLRDACGVDEVVMMLATDRALHAQRSEWTGSADLRVALATTHLPLREVADAITFERLTRITTLLAEDLTRQFGISAPRIAVCGLNPHAGEEGHLGHEEIEIIAPAIAHLRGLGLDIRGPYPADTLFTPKHLDGVDAVLAMYHDQGLSVLKYAGFGQAANITLGLPLVRTSVDHGTALDLAGRGVASPESLRVAIDLARTLSERRARPA
ncbi:4-hydroxythreonine-4-phosphate dehydrogenase PdxA [Halomonas sp. HNIBRBA4712]|uniref:4-hydroxythreonine-4-phosphate dehydrogenase PdxA n=1 Tax=Halomonas sp. HNIBRBA4712 TaxID=3373087 RepID=UPI0037458583